MNFRKLLLPFSLLYGLITWTRNLFYDTGFFRSVRFDIPVICVGNLNTGGTGKTPHVEYIIQLFKNSKVIATLSRGYGRASKGFIIAKPNMNSEILGDEPFQYFLKFPEIMVAVGENRINGVEKLLSKHPGINAVILDDAFQHRSVKAGLNILLTDYSDLFINDQLLPAGNLREPKSGYKRADIIIVTKCPSIITVGEKQELIKVLKPLSHQKILFSFFSYEILTSFFSGMDKIEISQLKDYEVLLVTGIANTRSIKSFLSQKAKKLNQFEFPDHHYYTDDDIKKVQRNFDNIAAQKKIIITTEKDFMRLNKEAIKKKFPQLPFYYLPVNVDFDSGDKKIFEEKILNYVGKN